MLAYRLGFSDHASAAISQTEVKIVARARWGIVLELSGIDLEPGATKACQSDKSWGPATASTISASNPL